VRIGFDLDGVLADLHGPFVQAAIRLFPELDPAAIASRDVGSSPPDADADAGKTREAGDETASPAGDVPLTRRQTDAVWEYLESVENFWETLGEIESGAIRRLATLADERRWEVIFITSRPSSAGLTVQRQSQRWLQRHGFELPSAFVVHGSRGRVCEALRLDVLVDDRPENCLDVVLESKAAAILVWRGTKENVPVSARRLGIAVVPTVARALDALIEAEKPGAEGAGFLDRLRRLFGLRTGSGASPLR
jgi:hypothetical protein